MTGRAVVLLLFAINARKDIRCREISLPWTFGIMAGGAGRQLILLVSGGGGANALAFASDLFLALLPGLLLLLLSRITAGKLGAGDGLAVLAAGFWTEAELLALTCLAAFAMVPAAAACIRPFRKNGKEWPFLPFLAAAWLLCAYSPGL